MYFAKFPNLKLSHWSQRKSILEAETDSKCKGEEVLGILSSKVCVLCVLTEENVCILAEFVQ